MCAHRRRRRTRRRIRKGSEVQAACDHRPQSLAEGGSGASHREKEEETDSERILKGVIYIKGVATEHKLKTEENY